MSGQEGIPRVDDQNYPTFLSVPAETFPTSHFYRNGVLVYTSEEKLELDELVQRIDEYLLS